MSSHKVWTVVLCRVCMHVLLLHMWGSENDLGECALSLSRFSFSLGIELKLGSNLVALPLILLTSPVSPVSERQLCRVVVSFLPLSSLDIFLHFPDSWGSCYESTITVFVFFHVC